jgi:hypothetical protein
MHRAIEHRPELSTPSTAMKKNVNSDNSEVDDVYSVSSLRSDESEEEASL